MSALSTEEVELITEARDLLIQQESDIQLLGGITEEQQEYRAAHVKKIRRQLTDLVERKGPR